MKLSRMIAVVLGATMVLSVFSAGLTGCGVMRDVETNGSPDQGDASDQDVWSAYTGAIDTKYAYDLAVEITEGEATNSSIFGDRQAGSDAEHATADLLAKEMEKLGLSDVEKMPAPVDKWQFNGASLLLDGESKPMDLHSYATAATPKGGIDAEVVYVGKGTASDYEGVDIKGKIALFDVDQRADWWVTYPMLEAQHQGAVAALACSNKGFSEISKDAYNCQDICGPTAIPTLSITVNQSDAIRKALKSGPVKGHLEVDNIVEPGGTTYNVFGRIKGKDSSEAIMYGAHYDAHFQGFLDDTIAATGVLAIAKAFIDSGYTPERDIWFVLHGAEEWGSSGTQYDWCTGAWELINNSHPEWAGKLLTFFNFELPAYEFADYTYSASAPELYTFIRDFSEYPEMPKPDGVFKEGVLTDGFQTYTYSDDFSYYAAGVPAVINGFLLTKDGDDVFPFYYNYYHTNFDTKELYNEGVYHFNLDYYGRMGIAIDSAPAFQLDFTNQADRLTESLDRDIAEKYGIDYDAYVSAINAYNKAAESANAKIADINERYSKALIPDAEDTPQMKDIWEEARALNKENLAIFKETQDTLLGLVYESPVVPHEAPQENIGLIDETLKALQGGDTQSALNDFAVAINGYNEWYNVFFSKAVTDQFYDMFYSEANADNLYWGTGRAFPWANVDDAVRSLAAKSGQKSPDLDTEKQAFLKARDEQVAIYKKMIGDETTVIKKLTERLANL